MSSMPEATDDLNRLMSKIRPFAAELGHEYVLPEHLLYLLLENERVEALLLTLSVLPEEVKEDLDGFFATKVEHLPRVERVMDSLAFARIVQTAALQACNSEKPTFDVIDLLVALFSDREETHAKYFLERAGLERLDVLREVSTGIYGPDEFERGFEPGMFDDSPDLVDDRRSFSVLAQYGVNMSEMAREGRLDPIIGRKNELLRVMQALNRRKKNNPLLVGEAGVGKTAIVEGLALKIADGDVPERVKDLEIWGLDMGGMVAGTKYRGEFEERIKKIIDEVKGLSNVILFIDEMHTVVGAGAVSSGSLDASNILKPALQSGEIRCIGATTYEEYKNRIQKDRAFCRRFQKIDVDEPTVNEATAILVGLRPYYEQHFGVTYSLNALETAVKLTHRYLSDRFLPDKAIDVIDEAGARNALKDKRAKKTITYKDVEEIVAEIANIPPTRVSTSDLSLLRDLEASLKQEVYGQDAAITRVAKAVKINRAGIGNKDKPSGSFLFAGPTGVGKTELARQLASQLGIQFRRFDMSEFAEKHTVSKLIGAPPGYVGFEQAGLLTEALIKTPHCVVLLDEIEKAHPDIYNILLQIMDYGTLTDNNGRKADFRNAIIIMTSNVGAKQLDANVIGFTKDDDVNDRTQKEVEKYFSPEFRNRLDSIVYFHRLNLDLMERIVDKFINQLTPDLEAKNIKIEMTEPARIWFGEHGYDPKLGARPLERLIRTEIQEKLVDEILFGDLSNGGTVKVTIKKDQVELKIKPGKKTK